MHTIPQQTAAPLSLVTADWIDELDHHLGWNDKPRSYRLLTAVLRAMRADAAPTNYQKSGEFPVRLCGTRCDDLPFAENGDDLGHFLGRVALGFKPDLLESPESAIVTVLRLLSHKLSGFQLEMVQQKLPSELRFAEGSAHDDDA
jgi:uncharacterized protein (DUF2267 family)